MLSADDLQQALRALDATTRVQQTALQWVADDDGQPLVTEHAGHLRATVRLILYDKEWGHIDNIKEQECVVVLAAHRDTSPARLAAYLEGWVQALTEVLSLPGVDVDRLMPSDLLMPSVLSLKTAYTAADFQARLLVKSRLGRLRPRVG